MYSTIAGENFHHPRRVGPLAGATHQGTAGVPGEGPYVVLWFQVEQEVIGKVAYKTFGCPAAIASASIMAELVEGKSIAQALMIRETDIVSALCGLPEGKEHCPKLAVRALKAAFNEAAAFN